MERVVPRSRAILGDGAARLEWAPLRAAARLLRGLSPDAAVPAFSGRRSCPLSTFEQGMTIANREKIINSSLTSSFPGPLPAAMPTRNARAQPETGGWKNAVSSQIIIYVTFLSCIFHAAGGGFPGPLSFRPAPMCPACAPFRHPLAPRERVKRNLEPRVSSYTFILYSDILPFFSLKMWPPA